MWSSSKNQWAFRKGSSTEYLMLQLTETWKSILDTGKVVGVLFPDFRKEFDSICHKTLIKKSLVTGVSGKLVKLLKSYLSDRQQYTEIDRVC